LGAAVKTQIYAPRMPEAMDMEELRRGVDRIDPQDTLGDYEEEVDLIYQALDLTSVDEAKAAIIDVLKALRAVSESGFPVGAEEDLAELVGFQEVI
jgi:hypothetical protein